MIESAKISGIGDYEEVREPNYRGYAKRTSEGEVKMFVVEHENTVEVRTDGNLAKLLKEQYESVMDSRYFGRGGIEVVLSGQIPDNEIEDLVRLSYNLTK